MLRFHFKSLLIFSCLLIIEILIALFIKDDFIRPFGGDILVIPLLYYFVNSFVSIYPPRLIIAVVLFAFLIECSQYFEIIRILGLEESHFWQTIIGTSFHWLDLVCYVVGGLLTYLMEKFMFNE